MKIHKMTLPNTRHVEYWYDATRDGGRSWWAREVDANGNQVGDAIFAFSRRELLADIKFTFGRS